MQDFTNTVFLCRIHDFLLSCHVTGGADIMLGAFWMSHAPPVLWKDIVYAYVPSALCVWLCCLLVWIASWSWAEDKLDSAMSCHPGWTAFLYFVGFIWTNSRCNSISFTEYSCYLCWFLKRHLISDGIKVFWFSLYVISDYTKFIHTLFEFKYHPSHLCFLVYFNCSVTCGIIKKYNLSTKMCCFFILNIPSC